MEATIPDAGLRLAGRAGAQQLEAAGVFSTANPNQGRSRTPSALPRKAAGSHSQACRLPDRMPLK
ncbi:Uncharacterised protein [Bordetella pertussis]|nr:Uncharacterised protein [Bordetella pertussis]CPJ81448.1 Uncharacterised protein [Bordetella pertussis]CPO18545.1 Uncharacterised protein [Bordetella pertussis]CRE27691.1 Uncharacterised protein [Bordetella pertussis]CRE31419.1 Uncharacterised protein [Bordetella pertussis]